MRMSQWTLTGVYRAFPRRALSLGGRQTPSTGQSLTHHLCVHVVSSEGGQLARLSETPLPIAAFPSPKALWGRLNCSHRTASCHAGQVPTENCPRQP